MDDKVNHFPKASIFLSDLLKGISPSIVVLFSCLFLQEASNITSDTSTKWVEMKESLSIEKVEGEVLQPSAEKQDTTLLEKVKPYLTFKVVVGIILCAAICYSFYGSGDCSGKIPPYFLAKPVGPTPVWSMAKEGLIAQSIIFDGRVSTSNPKIALCRSAMRLVFSHHYELKSDTPLEVETVQELQHLEDLIANMFNS